MPISSKNSTRVRADIRRVFLEVWDPIRINDEPNAQDEYDSYIGGAFDLLINKASDQQFETYLKRVVAGMGMDGSRHCHADVIASLRAIPLAEPA